MKTEGGLQLPSIVPVLVLALLLNPFAYGLPQEASSGPSANAQSDDLRTPQSSSVVYKTDDKRADEGSDNSDPAKPVATQSDSIQPSSSQLPDSPGSVQSRSVQSAQLAPPPLPSQALPQAQPKEPLGTAAAETVPTMGVAASQPAGAALAPAKQRRVRTILITVGAILGAGAAVGATMALSEGSPSKPPGTR